MDLNPTFGHQELLETLSQASGATSKSGGGGKANGDNNSRRSSGDLASRNSENNYASTMSVQTGTSHVDEAVKRLGYRLSLQAHGDDSSGNNPSRVSVAARPFQQSSDSSFFQFEKGKQGSSPLLAGETRVRTKVAKTRYSDHGDHHQKRPGTSHVYVLKKLTCELKDRFMLWEEQYVERRRHSRHLSPHRQALSQLALDSGHSGGPHDPTLANDSSHQNNTTGSLHARHHRRRHHADSASMAFENDASVGSGVGGNASSTHHGGKGLLSAVLEGHSDSAATSTTGHAGDRSSRASVGSQSISTKGTPASSFGAVGSLSSAPPAAKGQCLTAPSDPVHNNGLDNCEGNLIVFENDVIVVPRKNVRSMRKEKGKEGGRVRSAEFRVLSLQGQGTFAQVFQCLHVQTGEKIALKIIKNKPAYTRQAAIEIDIFQTLQEDERKQDQCATNSNDDEQTSSSRDYMVNLISYFMHQNHLCLVFELLGLNLYEVLKRRQFRGLPLTVVRDFVFQAVDGIRDLAQKNIVHCDLKPENMLLVSEDANKRIIDAGEQKSSKNLPEVRRKGKVDSCGSKSSLASSGVASSSSSTIQANNVHGTGPATCKMKLIDFGSACFEGYTAHTYIQSRFYRSPEVLIGLPYDSAIDMWSLGCVAAELFLGLPILPGVHEHDQIGRVAEMLADLPDWMLDQGSKATKYFVKFVPRPNQDQHHGGTDIRTPSPSSHAPSLPQWRMKTQQEYISSLSQSEITKKGGLAKLSKQPGNRYFKRKKLSDILVLHAQKTTGEERALVPAFVHFLYGVLDPDPWKRFTAFQASQHPFVTGDLSQLRIKGNGMKLNAKEENQANMKLDVFWQSPWDPAICRRKLLNVQKMREKQQSMRRGMSSRSHGHPKSPMDLSNIASDRRRRHGSAESPASNQASYHNEEPSPPNQISSSDSTSALMSSHDGSGALHPSTSWNGQGQPGINAQLSTGKSSSVMRQDVMAPPSNFHPAGPQSFQGVSFTPTEADFAHALQRPGVVPGTLATSFTSQGSYQQSNNSVSMQSSHARGLNGQHASNQGHNLSFGSMGVGGQMQNTVSLDSESMMGSQFNQGLHRAANTSVPGQVYSNVPGQVINEQKTSRGGDAAFGTSYSSANSSVTMPDAAFVDPQQLAFLQQQQIAMMNQQQQQMAMMNQQQQQFGMMQQQAQFALQPQQPVLLQGAPGGGYYYVTTSATGQPIILQPVGMLNQHGGQPIMAQPGQTNLFGQAGPGFVPQQLNAQVQAQGLTAMNPAGINLQQTMNQGLQASQQTTNQGLQPSQQPSQQPAPDPHGPAGASRRTSM